MKVSSTFKYWLPLLFFFYNPSETLGESVPVTTECPTGYIQGVDALVKCYINTDLVKAANCAQNVKTVYVSYLYQSKTVTLCETTYPGTCTSSSEVTCGCISSAGGINTYQAYFKPNITEHSGSTLECSVDCGSPINSTNGKTCQSITIAAATSPPTSTTTSAETTSTTTAGDSSASISTSEGDSTISLTGPGKSAGTSILMTSSIGVMIISSLSVFF